MGVGEIGHFVLPYNAPTLTLQDLFICLTVSKKAAGNLYNSYSLSGVVI